MNETLKCQTCGAEFAPGTPMGNCPRCLFGLGLEEETTAAHRPPRLFASYELVRQLGCGGMGWSMKRANRGSAGRWRSR
jgi:hypothetical protein